MDIRIHEPGRGSGTAVKHFPCNRALNIQDGKRVLGYYEAILHELAEVNPCDPRILRNLLDNLLLQVKRDAERGEAASRIPREYLRARQTLQDHYQEGIQVSDLAGQANVSVAHFSKRFKHYFSCSPIEYLTSVRMEQAAYLLKDPNLSITDIARMTGYENIHYFSRVVKKAYGLSPRALRRAGFGG
ncbi:MAG: helix-turn-helix transcriptional regulator [Planctomycetota bacterium]|jgi:AraC-like DNA-binding protein